MLMQIILAFIVIGVASSSNQGSSTAFCGNQPCPSPMKCQQHGDVYVCVRVPPPTCAATSCPSGFECVLQQALCNSLPCNPQPFCVRSNPCGICIAPDEFCELLPVPFCRRVVEPTCANRICPPGQECREEPVACFRPPCLVNLVCG